ncbi:hypothetical protein THF1C08_50298 [Vibrio jasicida]|jgi:hypothetical protein|uniref:Uncharacterized protein n=1 Tax=Vibrio jasicida TaxID=766224 RepID=A0AAU9QWL4_9VIBR|nr:hypothetical protein THF1C08_50298 [Vibrio jasicida]CAH1601450.1 hypothetical protein THF1A12_50048 [Vibrio jasicida]
MINIALLIVPILGIFKIWEIGLHQFDSGLMLIEAIVVQLLIAGVSAKFGFWHINNRK